MLAIGLIGAGACTVQAQEAATATPNPTPGVGDVHAETGCEWVANGQTSVFAFIYGDHRGLLPPAIVRDRVVNGIPEDDVVHEFRWYHPHSADVLRSGRGVDAFELYESDYRLMRGAVELHGDIRVVKNVYTPDGRLGAQIGKERITGGAAGSGDGWTYWDRYTLRGCFHVLPGSTPAGHHAFIE